MDENRLLDLFGVEDFDDWSYDDDDEILDDFEDTQEEDETEYYFGDNTMFFCPRCNEEYVTYDEMEKCFQRCQKELLTLPRETNL